MLVTIQYPDGKDDMAAVLLDKFDIDLIEYRDREVIINFRQDIHEPTDATGSLYPEWE